MREGVDIAWAVAIELELEAVGQQGEQGRAWRREAKERKRLGVAAAAEERNAAKPREKKVMRYDFAQTM